MPPPAPPRSRRRIGEIVGGTSAECLAICCCCPCALLSLLIYAVVKLPAAIFRKTFRNRRRRRRRRNYLNDKVGPNKDHDASRPTVEEDWGIPTTERSPELEAMEKEMMDRFCNTGFWRSPSRCRDEEE